MYNCGMCHLKSCKNGSLKKAPNNCPSRDLEQNEIKKLYSKTENYKIAYNAALVEVQGYCEKTRIDETIDFAKKNNFNNLGLAFCSGLSKEAKVLSEIFRHKGFQVNSIICKNGSIEKEFINLEENDKIKPNEFEAMCNPIGQAIILKKANTDLNMILGLCVGHDSLFIKYSEAPVTVVGVKDRVLCHNPVSALYLSEGYYKKKFFST